jgi:hypothetical protein
MVLHLHKHTSYVYNVRMKGLKYRIALEKIIPDDFALESFRTEHRDAYDRKPTIWMFPRQTLVELQLFKMLKGRYKKDFHIMTSRDFYHEYDILELSERKRVALEVIGNPIDSPGKVRYDVRPLTLHESSEMILPSAVDSIKINGDVAEVGVGSDVLMFEYNPDYGVWYSIESLREDLRASADGYSNFLMVLMFNPIKKEEKTFSHLPDIRGSITWLISYGDDMWLPYPS